MKKYKNILALVLALLMIFTACGSKDNSNAAEEKTSDADTSASAETGTEAAETSGNTTGSGIDYSRWIDETGRWKDIVAADHVEMGEYMGITLTDTVPSEAEVMDEINALLEAHAVETYNVERAVENGDDVNIDYVGSIDGVEFEGGSTQGAGTVVTAGSAAYIDDFLTQIIGHFPGETFDVNVTFPENYGNAELNGKDAVFVTTINYIVESIPITYTDEAIAGNLYEDYGVSTTDELYAYVEDFITSDRIYAGIEDHIFATFSAKDIPEQLSEYQKENMRSYYQQYAASYGVSFDEFLLNYMGATSFDEIFESYEDDTYTSNSYFLFMQAIAEKESIVIKDSDVDEFLTNQVGESMVDSYKNFYGMNYLKMLVTQNKVYDLIRENAVIE